jgi:Tfp pilus assembly protein PilX
MRSQPSRTCWFAQDPGVAVRPRPGQGRFQNHGVALIITLLLLFLLSVIGLAAVMSSSSDLMINGYYKNYRGSFYAADSGLNMARQAISTYFNNNAPATWPTTQSSATTAGGTLATSAGTYVTGLYGNSYSLNGQGQAGNSVPSSFTIITATVSLPTQPSGTQTSGNYTQWSYVYNYTLESQGASQGSETAQVIEKGAITVNITQGSGTTTTNASFAAFGAFIDSFSACQGPLVQGYMTGPMYALGQWNLSTGSSPGYTFSDPVSQTGSQFSYWDGGNCNNSSSVPYTDGWGNTVNPSFQSGYNLNVTPVALPPNDFSQKWAVLDGKGCGEGSSTCGGSTAPPAPTNTQMNAVLKNVNQTAYPTAGASSGVYLPYTCTSGVCSLNSNAGGIYVEGSGNGVSTTVTLSTTNGAGGSASPSGQVYKIVQGSTTTTVTIDSQANTTTVVSGGTTLVLSGVPQNQLASPAQPATMLYVNGDVSISGPSSGAAIQNNSMVNVTANGDITQTGNILYANEPVTTSANQIVSGSSPACCNGSPADTLIPQNQNMNQVLGLFTANGNFVLSPSSNGANIETDASVCMLSQAGATDSSIGHMATGNSVGAWTNIGGRMENRAAGVSMSSSNIYFDRRFQARNFAPPWFPSTTVSTNMLSSTVTASSSASAPSRTFWQYQAGQ